MGTHDCYGCQNMLIGSLLRRFNALGMPSTVHLGYREIDTDLPSMSAIGYP
jgi:hypothetical protein